MMSRRGYRGEQTTGPMTTEEKASRHRRQKTEWARRNRARGRQVLQEQLSLHEELKKDNTDLRRTNKRLSEYEEQLRHGLHSHTCRLKVLQPVPVLRTAGRFDDRHDGDIVKPNDLSTEAETGKTTVRNWRASGANVCTSVPGYTTSTPCTSTRPPGPRAVSVTRSCEFTYTPRLDSATQTSTAPSLQTLVGARLGDLTKAARLTRPEPRNAGPTAPFSTEGLAPVGSVEERVLHGACGVATTQYNCTALDTTTSTGTVSGGLCVMSGRCVTDQPDTLHCTSALSSASSCVSASTGPNRFAGLPSDLSELMAMYDVRFDDLKWKVQETPPPPTPNPPLSSSSL